MPAASVRSCSPFWRSWSSTSRTARSVAANAEVAILPARFDVWPQAAGRVPRRVPDVPAPRATQKAKVAASRACPFRLRVQTPAPRSLVLAQLGPPRHPPRSPSGSSCVGRPAPSAFQQPGAVYQHVYQHPPASLQRCLPALPVPACPRLPACLPACLAGAPVFRPLRPLRPRPQLPSVDDVIVCRRSLFSFPAERRRLKGHLVKAYLNAPIEPHRSAIQARLFVVLVFFYDVVLAIVVLVVVVVCPACRPLFFLFFSSRDA